MLTFIIAWLIVKIKDTKSEVEVVIIWSPLLLILSMSCDVVIALQVLELFKGE